MREPIDIYFPYCGIYIFIYIRRLIPPNFIYFWGAFSESSYCSRLLLPFLSAFAGLRSQDSSHHIADVQAKSIPGLTR